MSFAPSFLITLHIFRSPSIIPSENTRSQRCIKCPALWNSHRPSVILSVIVTCRQNTDGLESICKVVGDGCGISSDITVKCRWTVIRLQSRRWWNGYCEMLTNCNPFATSSMMKWLLWNADGLESVHKVIGDGCGISSDATVKCRRNGIHPQSRRWWLWHFQRRYCEISMDWNPSAKSLVMVVAFPVTLLWNADEL